MLVLLPAIVCFHSAAFAEDPIRSNNADDAPAAAPDLTGAQWLWRSDLTDMQVVQLQIPPEIAYFKYSIDLPSTGIKAAWFAGTADDQLSLFVNGSNPYNSADWREMHVVDILPALTNGMNTIRLEAHNFGTTPNAGGMVAKIMIEHADGSIEEILTGKEWLSSLDGSNWATPTVLGRMGGQPWGLLGNSRRALPDDFPRFLVPGQGEDMNVLRDLFFEHYRFFPYGTLWDAWMAKSLLWPATEAASNAKSFSVLLGNRIITDEGYVSTHQHRGMAHDLGWPFPIWTQIQGWGWHFSGTGNPFALPAFNVFIQHSLDGWDQDNLSNITYSNEKGLHADLSSQAMLETPPFRVEAMSTPFVRLEWWAEGLEDAKPYLEWTTEKKPKYSSSRRLYFDPADSLDTQTVSMIPLQDVTEEDEVFTRFRIGFGNPKAARIAIQAMMTACDSRHNINNAVWLIGCWDYIRLAGDVDFIKQQTERMRLALRYAITEFGTKENLCVNTPWRGHDGRSGIVYKDGQKTVRHGFGVGNNYWDLLPFGGKDFTATLYLHDALLHMAALEEAIGKNPEWGIDEGLNPEDLRKHAADIQCFSQTFFWNEETGRFFGAIDVDGAGHDYGFTFMNLDAVSRGMASPDQSRSIMDWVSGQRTVRGDTSQGDDIYHWRFSPRMTTLRNTNYYSSVWTTPENIPFGDQVQDGGAVLGFSYDDLMARLKVYGPDSAWKRLREIIQWYREVQAEGGVRAYYAKPGRGKLQGGGTAGGLGIDEEFMESALVPQIMLYGFMGFDPRMDGFALSPQLPSDWPSLKLTDVSFQGGIYDLYADREKVLVSMKAGPARMLVLDVNGREEVDMAPGTAHQVNLK